MSLSDGSTKAVRPTLKQSKRIQIKAISCELTETHLILSFPPNRPFEAEGKKIKITRFFAIKLANWILENGSDSELG